jgi:hypothetical protein
LIPLVRSLAYNLRTRPLVELHGAAMARAVLGRLHELGCTCAGELSPHLDPVGYGRIGPDFLPGVQGAHDVHFVAASRNPDDLPAGWEEWHG